MKTNTAEQKEKSGWLNHNDALKMETQIRAEVAGMKVDRYSLVKRGGFVRVIVLVKDGVRKSFQGRGNNADLRAIAYMEAANG